NYVAWDGTLGMADEPDGESFYERASELFKKVETGRYWSRADAIVIADPEFKDAMRLATDRSGNPVFKEAAGVDRLGQPYDTLFTVPVFWSHGSRTIISSPAVRPARASTRNSTASASSMACSD